MSWMSEHGAHYEVPKFIEFLVKKGILEDVSWHNDSCPRFQVPSKVEKPAGEPYGISLWVEYPLKFMRESGGKRFHVWEGQLMADPDDAIDTDDLADALDWMFRRMGKYLAEYAGVGREDMEAVALELYDEYYGRI